MNAPIKLVIFDWDGTLMDSVHLIVRCMHGAISDMGLAPRSDNEVSNVIGLGLLEACSMLYPGSDAAFAHTLADHYRSHFLQVKQVREDLFPGVMELLDQLRRGGVKIAVATGKSRRGLDHTLNEIGLNDTFDITRCADETRSKPHPQMLFEILEALQIDAENAVMIGDTEYDLEMAQQANMASIGVCYGVHEAERLQQFAPLACIDSILKIREILPLPAPAS